MQNELNQSSFARSVLSHNGEISSLELAEREAPGKFIGQCLAFDDCSGQSSIPSLLKGAEGSEFVLRC